MEQNLSKFNNEAYIVSNPSSPNQMIIFDPELCDGCNKCIDFCRTDCLHPNPEPGKPPILLYPDECWYGGCCAGACDKNACRMDLPVALRMVWKRKETGEIFRVGGKNDLPPNTKPACG